METSQRKIDTPMFQYLIYPICMHRFFLYTFAIPNDKTTMKLNKDYIEKLKDFEGYRANPYTPKGEASSNYVTIGYGCRILKSAAKDLAPLTPAIADRLLRDALVSCEHAVKALILSAGNPRMSTRSYDLSDDQYTALVDFVYNVGEGALKRSTLRKKILAACWTSEHTMYNPQDEYAAGDTADICNEFLRWNKSGGVVLPGLTKRCRYRASLWESRPLAALNKYRAYFGYEPIKSFFK